MFYIGMVLLLVIAIGICEVFQLTDGRRRRGNVMRHREARLNLRGTYIRVHRDGSSTFERVIHDRDVDAVDL